MLEHKILKEAVVEELRPVVAPTASEEIPSASAAASIVPTAVVAAPFQSPTNAREVLRRGVVMEEFGAQARVHSKCSTKMPKRERRRRKKKIDADRWAHPVRNAFRRGQASDFATW